MDWSKITERISRLAQEVQSIAQAVEDKRSELAPLEEQIILLERDINLYTAELDKKLRSELISKYGKITEKLLDRTLLLDPIFKEKYSLLQDYKAKKARLDCELKSLESRLKAVDQLRRLAELDVSYLFKMGIITNDTYQEDYLKED